MLYSITDFNTTFWVDLALSLIILGVIIFGIIKLKLSYKVLIGLIAFFVLLLLCDIFSLNIVHDFLWFGGALIAVYLLLTLNPKEKETFLFQPKKSSISLAELSLSETDELFAKLNKTVEDLSRNKTGALITIERKDNLTPFLSTSGVNIDAPVSAELLETIFFDKTPLHDGAVIIRGNYIVAASVFYQPTQRALSGKYGSRHRAAIGISEVCDAITIVVSEETGRVSFAINGELTTVPVSDFISKLKEYY